MVLDVNVNLPTNIKFNKHNSAHIRLLQETICYNQGKLTEYGYSASEKHKQLKEHINSGDKDALIIQGFIDELDEYLNLELLNHSKENFKFLKRYFHGRSDIEPRVCIKISHNNSIVPLTRDKQYIQNKEYPLEANTGFSEIALRTGIYFIQNDIPNAIKHKEYRNARINMDAALRYKKSNLVKRLLKKRDDDWIECWEKIDGADGERNTPPPETCYKSTLIIPMTLLNNQLTPEFKKRFQIEDEVSLRSIYGFLCLDHQETNYFEEEQDVAIGYIFADLLCMYLINQLIYTTNSTTYNAANKLIT